MTDANSLFLFGREDAQKDGYLEQMRDTAHVRCLLTSHVLPLSNVDAIQAFLRGKRRKRLLEKKREEVALLRDYAPALTQSKYLPDKFFCRVTGRYVPKIEKLVVERCSGKRFTVGQAKVTGKKQALLDERDPKEEQEAKMKRREANRQMAEKMRETRLKEWEERQMRRKMAMDDGCGEENMEEEEGEEEEEEEEGEEEEAPTKKRAKR